MAAMRAWRDASGLRAEANDAGRGWGLLHGISDDDWLALAEEGLATESDDVELPVGRARLPVRCRRITLPDGALWWLAPRGMADDSLRLLLDQLDLAQEFGRMGLFLRDIDTGAGHWDRHVYRIFGLQEGERTPDFAQVLGRCLHPDDIERLNGHHRAISAGDRRGSVRFRIRRPDGEVRHIHSLYEVRAGVGGRKGHMVGVLIDDTEITERIAAERRASEILNRALQLAGVSVWRIDLGARRIRFNATGHDEPGLDGSHPGMPLDTVDQAVHPEDLDAVLKATDEAAASGQVVDLVARFRDGQGAWRPMLTRRVADRDEAGRPLAVAGISLDISALVAERERADALAVRARLAAETIGVGFWSREGGTGQGAVHWDEQMFRIHRRSPALGPPAIDEWIEQCVHPQDQARVQEIQARTMHSWDVDTEIMFRLPEAEDGERWVQSWTRRVVRDGRRLAFGMHLDVTAQRRQQALLQREHERQRYAIHAAGIGVWERGLDGRISYWSEAMYRLRGLDPADPRRPEDLLAATTHPDDHAAMLAKVGPGLWADADFRGEYRVRGTDGHWRWIATQGHEVRDADGRPCGMAGVNFDITERKRADALMLEMQRAEQASRDKSAFMARMSHELRTPMNAVLGFAQLMEDDAIDPPTERQRARLQRIREAGSQLMALIEDVLDLSRLDSEPPVLATAPFDLATAVGEAVSVVSPLADRQGHRLQVDPVPAATWVQGDARRLAQALGRLAAHALREHRPPGDVRIATTLEQQPSGPQVVISVSHGGPGLSPAAHAALFEPFSQAADTGSGSGSVALSLARRAVEAMGGTLQAATEPAGEGGGTVFRLSLPAVKAVLAEGATLAAPSLKLLCVEDNPVNLLLVRELLSMRPAVRLLEAADGLTGVALAVAERPDAVLLDLQLPDISGHEVLRRLRAEPSLAGCTFVALSANAMPADIDATLASGFDDYWTKPIDFDRFLAGIDRLIAAAARRLP